MIPIHVASIRLKGSPIYLSLKKMTLFQWFFLETDESTTCTAETLPLAIAKAERFWKEDEFRLLHCGFRYTLPERDEVGSNALFHQMAKSYSISNGRYFDEEVGHQCYVDFASQEALFLWRKLRDL